MQKCQIHMLKAYILKYQKSNFHDVHNGQNLNFFQVCLYCIAQFADKSKMNFNVMVNE